MKTAISVPDETFEEATRKAASLGVSRSEFFTHAVRRYLDQLEAESTTAAVDAALALAEDDDSNDTAALSGRTLLAAGDDDW